MSTPRDIPTPGQPSPQSIVHEIDQISNTLESIRSHTDQASDLAETGALAAMYAHEVNNLMTQVGGRAQLALMNLDQPERIIQALELAYRASSQIAQLSELFMSNPPTSSILDSDIPISEVHRRVLGFLSEQDIIDFGFTLAGSAEHTPTIPTVQLQQVLLNLYLNAIRAINALNPAKPGQIITRIQILEPDPTCSTWNTAQRIQIIVEDNGIGMCADQAAELFAGRTKKSGEGPAGHGLGLKICIRLLTKAHGTIHAESTPGAGTRMVITLPMSSSIESQSAA